MKHPERTVHTAVTRWVTAKPARRKKGDPPRRKRASGWVVDATLLNGRTVELIPGPAHYDDHRNLSLADSDQLILDTIIFNGFQTCRNVLGSELLFQSRLL